MAFTTLSGTPKLGECVAGISFLALESGNVFWVDTPSTDQMKAVLTELQAKLKAG